MTAFDPGSLRYEPLDTLLAATDVAGPDAAVDARLVAGLNRVTRPVAPLPWAWIALVIGLFAIAAVWDLREPAPSLPERELPWRYRPAVKVDGVDLREGRADTRPSSSFFGTP